MNKLGIMLSEKEQLSDTAAFKNFIQRHFRMLAIFLFTGGIFGFALTFFIPEEFRSVANVFPPSAPSIEHSIENPNFGYDVEADRLIQIFMSNDVRDSVSKKFNLADYYKINLNEPDWLDNLTKNYKKTVSFERTPSMSILIKARTRDPELSAGIVNYIIEVTDKLREKLYKQNIHLAFVNAREDYELQKSKSDSALDHLLLTLKDSKLNSMVILASNAQISMDIDKLNSAANNNPSVGSEIIAFKNLRDRFIESEGRLTRFRKAMSLPVPKLYVIDKAEARHKKVSPSFLMNAFIGMVFSGAILFIVLLTRSLFGSR